MITQRAPTARGRGEVRPDPVADHDRLAGVPPDGLGGQFQQVRLGLADRERRDAGRRLERRGHGAGARSQPALGRVDRVAVRGDEASAGTDAVRGGGEAQVGEVRVEAGDDGVRGAGGRVAIDALLVHAGRGVRGGHDLEADVAQLALQPARRRRRGPAGSRPRASPGGAPWPAPTRRPIGRDRRAHRREPGHVVGAVVHRVVRHVHHVVAAGDAVGEDRGDAGHGVGAAIDDTVEVDEEEQAHAADRSRRPEPA